MSAIVRADGVAPQRLAARPDLELDALGRHQGADVLDVVGELRRPPRRRTPRCRRAGRSGSAGRCPARGRCRGRCDRGRRPRGGRTARPPRAARGWAASRRPTRPGSARSPTRAWRSGPAGWWRRRPACCGARPPSSGGSRARRRPAPGCARRRGRHRWSGRCGPARGRARSRSTEEQSLSTQRRHRPLRYSIRVRLTSGAPEVLPSGR